MSTPAVVKAAKLIDAQATLAQDLDVALQRAVEARESFEREGAKLEALLSVLARDAGLAAGPGGLEYFGRERIALWVRGRGLASGFGAYEATQLEKLRAALTSAEEVLHG
jgi:hypothetical protein